LSILAPGSLDRTCERASGSHERSRSGLGSRRKNGGLPSSTGREAGFDFPGFAGMMVLTPPPGRITAGGERRFQGDDMSADGRTSYSRARRELMLAAAALWLCFGFVLPLLASQVPAINVFGVVIGFASMATISIVALVVALFWFAARQNTLEMAEDE